MLLVKGAEVACREDVAYIFILVLTGFVKVTIKVVFLPILSEHFRKVEI